MQWKQAPKDPSTLRTAAWVGVVVAAVGLLGLIYVPSLWPAWIAMLVFAIAAGPQVVLKMRR
jgi:fatty acid desaturase